MSVMVVAVIVLAAVVSVPVAAAVLVAVASRREDREWTLAGPAHGLVQMAARRIVAFDSEGMDWLTAAGPRRIRPAAAGYRPGTSRRPRPETAARPGRTWPDGPAERQSHSRCQAACPACRPARIAGFRGCPGAPR
jgi:hypothetical protein